MLTKFCQTTLRSLFRSCLRLSRHHAMDWYVCYGGNQPCEVMQNVPHKVSPNPLQSHIEAPHASPLNICARSMEIPFARPLQKQNVKQSSCEEKQCEARQQSTQTPKFVSIYPDTKLRPKPNALNS